MQIAFYAPMKSPEHPNPSGDRRIAQLLMRALIQGGHQVKLASEYRSYEGAGNAAAQSAIKLEAETQASALLNAYTTGKLVRPHIWFTYHLYHKAPDWIGPLICEALKIPYIIAEASYAPKQSGGLWDLGLRASKRAIAIASAVISFNAVDDGCISPLLKAEAKTSFIPPFVDTQPYADAARKKNYYRGVIAEQHSIDPDPPWLICVAMMRPGDKLRSYEQLGLALSSLQDRPWRLLVVGDGSAREQVKLALARLKKRVHWIGVQDSKALPGIYAACDIYVWPAVNEAFGMAFIEAQASGLVVIAGNSRGVSGVVNAPDCGLLVEPENPEALTAAIAKLLDEPQNRQAMASRARQHIQQHHDLDGGATALTRVLKEVTTCRS
jgi:glycosyltransferase involved in cell wall biosynthesis